MKGWMRNMEPVKKKEIKLNDFDIDQLARNEIGIHQLEMATNNYLLLIGTKEHGFNLNNVHRIEYNLKTKSAMIEEYDAKEFEKSRKEKAGPTVTTK